MNLDKDVKVLLMICFLKQQKVRKINIKEVRESAYFTNIREFSEIKYNNANQSQTNLDNNAFDNSGANEEKCSDSLDYHHHIILDDANQVKDESIQSPTIIANHKTADTKQEENAFIIDENVNDKMNDESLKTIQSQNTISSNTQKKSKWNRDDLLNKVNKLKKNNTLNNVESIIENKSVEKNVSEEQSRNYRSASKDFTNQILSSFKKEKDNLNDFPQKNVVPMDSISNNINERIRSRASLFTEDILKGVNLKARHSFI